MTQTIALILDAYKELNAKKLFWITLVLSALVGSLFAFIGINENGITVLVWDFSIGLNTAAIDRGTFYKLFFQGLGNFWLTWVATILAVVSTSSIFPDFVSKGSVEMLLSRPISRVRLYLTKFVLGLMFVLGQVASFTIVAFLAIGFRGGVWEPKLLLAIPIVLLFFSYLFCFNALIGTITRSTIATLLATLLFWGTLAGFNIADTLLLNIQAQSEIQLQQQQTMLGNAELVTQRQLDRARDNGDETAADGELPEGTDELEAANPLLIGLRQDVSNTQTTVDALETWHGRIIAIKTVLPKTADTVALLDRALFSAEEIGSIISLGETRPVEEREGPSAEQRVAEKEMSRPLSWVIGTSLIFECVLLAIGAWIFARRDY